VIEIKAPETSGSAKSGLAKKRLETKGSDS
jgi:hypothetical protein